MPPPVGGKRAAASSAAADTYVEVCIRSDAPVRPMKRVRMLHVFDANKTVVHVDKATNQLVVYERT